MNDDSGLTFPRHSQPDAASVMGLHRYHDGSVLFTWDNEKLRPMRAVPVALLGSELPGLIGELDADSYMTTSGYRAPKDARIRAGYAAKGNVSHLTAAWVDIDGHSAPGGAIEQWQIFGDVRRMIEKGVIPRPSIYVNSGRGVWLFWQLATAEVATPDAIDTLVRINRAAATILAPLGADRAATNVSRWTRVPGSLNTKSGTRCEYLFAHDAQQRPIVYTLAELAEAFHLPADTPARALAFGPAAAPMPTDRPKNPVKQRSGKGGWDGKHHNILRALLHLRSLRGGFRESTRGHACHYLSLAMSALRFSADTIMRELAAPGMFHPPLSVAEKRKHVDSEIRLARAKQTARISYQTIADDLRISPVEARAIQDCIGTRFPYIYENQVQPEPPGITPAERMAQRRQRVTELKTSDPSLSCRAVSVLLTAEGIECSHATISADFRALGLAPHRTEYPSATLSLDFP